jgi:hypothetical protein
MSIYGEGPQLVASQHRTCCFCRYHDQRMQISGMNPVYDHYCKHPESPKNRYAFRHDGSAWIGTSDMTPLWCPYLTGDTS